MKVTFPKKNTIPAIFIENVQKTYRHGHRPAVSGISLAVYPGEKVGLVGANGSGKTTLLRLLMNFLRPDAGKISVFGEDDLENAKKWIGFLPEHQEGLENFTPEELFEFAGKFHGMRREDIRTRIAKLVRFTDIKAAQDQLLAGFSKGMVQRILLGIALFHSPRILLLDEPMSGLDPQGREDLLNLLRQLSDFTLIYTSHQLEDVENLCQRVLFLKEGAIAGEVNLTTESEAYYVLALERKFLSINTEVLPVKVRSVATEADTAQIEFKATPAQLEEILDICKQHHISIHKIKTCSILSDFYQKFVVGAKS